MQMSTRFVFEFEKLGPRIPIINIINKNIPKYILYEYAQSLGLFCLPCWSKNKIRSKILEKYKMLNFINRS